MATKTPKDRINEQKRLINQLTKEMRDLDREAYRYGADVSPAFHESGNIYKRLIEEKRKLKVLEDDAKVGFFDFLSNKNKSELKSSTGKITNIDEIDYTNVTIKEYLSEIGYDSKKLPLYHMKQEYEAVPVEKNDNRLWEEISDDKITENTKWFIERKGCRARSLSSLDKDKNNQDCLVDKIYYDSRDDVFAVQAKHNISFLNLECNRVNVKKGDYIVYSRYLRHDYESISKKDFHEKYENSFMFLDKVHELIEEKINKQSKEQVGTKSVGKEQVGTKSVEKEK